MGGSMCTEDVAYVNARADRAVAHVFSTMIDPYPMKIVDPQYHIDSSRWREHCKELRREGRKDEIMGFGEFCNNRRNRGIYW
jgi:hypothetical protein